MEFSSSLNIDLPLLFSLVVRLFKSAQVDVHIYADTMTVGLSFFCSTRP